MSKLASVVKSIVLHLRTPLYRNGYLLVAMRVLGTGLGFVYWALAARLTRTEQMGTATGVISAATLLAELAQLGVGYALVRHLAADSRPRRLIAVALAVPGAIGLVLAVGFLTTLQAWSEELAFLRSTPTYALLFVLLTVSWALSIGLHWVFVATRRALYSLVRQATHVVLAVLLLVVLSRFLAGTLPFVVSHAVAVTLSVVLAISLLAANGHARKRSQATPGRQATPLRPIARYALMSYITAQVHHVPNTLLPVVILHQLGPQEAAYFFVVWTVMGALPSWVGAMGESLFAEGSYSPSQAGTYAKKSGLLSLGLITAIVLILVLGGRFVLGLFGPDYAEHGLGAFRAAALAAIPTVLLSTFYSYLRVRDRVNAVFVISVVNGVMRLAFVSLGVMTLGIVGGALGWSLSAWLVVGASAVWWRQQSKLPHPWQAYAAKGAEGGS